MATRTALFSRTAPGGVWTIDDMSEHPGDIWFVDSGATGATDAAGYGQSPDKPFATLDYAESVCTANNGDVIYLMPGHAETVATAGAISFTLAGITVIGLGKGADRPTFTFSATAATWTIAGASTHIENIIIKPSINAVVSPLLISGADCILKDIEAQDASATVEMQAVVLTTATADRLLIDGLVYRGYITGDTATRVIALVGVDGAIIRNCYFYGIVSTAMINFETTYCYNISVHDCYFYNESAALTRNVVDTKGSGTWQVFDCYDGKAGYNFSGGSAGALAGDDVGVLSGAVSTVDSKVVSTATVLSGGTSTADSKIVSGVTVLSGAVSSVLSKAVIISEGVSTADSKIVSSVTVLSGAVSSVLSKATIISEGVSTADSKIVSAVVVLSGGVSTADSKIVSTATVLSGAVSSVLSKATIISEGVSTADSKVVSVAVVLSGAVSGVASQATILSGAVSTVTSYATALNAWDYRTVSKAVALDEGSVNDVFTVSGGPVMLLNISLIVTEAVSAHNCTAKWQLDPDLATADTVDLCNTVDIISAAIGNVFGITGTAANAMVKYTAGPLCMVTPVFLQAGGVDLVLGSADPDAGAGTAYLTYLPLASGAVVTPAA